MKKYAFCVFFMSCCLTFGMESIAQHPLMSSENVELLYRMAKKISVKIDSEFPSERQVLVGLGQSPAYLLEMIKLIDEKEDRRNRSYKRVAFSGNFLSSVFFDAIRFRRNVLFYRDYLGQIGLSEENFGMGDVKYIILEVCHHGDGLRSFLSFFDNYKIKPSVCYLQTAGFRLVTCSNVDRIMRYGITVREEEKLTVDLANADKFDDRLVPHFAFHEWGITDPLAFVVEPNAIKIIETLRRFLASHCLTQDSVPC